MGEELLANGQTQFAIDWDIVSRIVLPHSNLQLAYAGEITMSKSHWYNPLTWSLPAISHVEVSWDRVRTDADVFAQRDARNMRVEAKDSAADRAPFGGRNRHHRPEEERFVDSDRDGPDAEHGVITKARRGLFLKCRYSVRMTAGAAVLASNSEPTATDALVAELNVAKDAKLRAIVRSLEVANSDQTLRQPLVCSPMEIRRTPARCVSSRHSAGTAGGEVTAAFASNISDAQVEALRAARLAREGTADKYVSAGLRHADPAIR